MNKGFHRRAGALWCDGVPLARLARDHGTPAWVYSQSVLETRWKTFAAALADLEPTICYALKANSNQAVIATFAALGAGADIVSIGEFARARAAGVPAKKIVFAGVGKTEAEMAVALKAGILQFNVESEPELAALARVARTLGKTASVALRVNPDVDAKTHRKITTGKSENKFGIELAHARAIALANRRTKGIRIEALSTHIGSQITDVTPYRAAFRRVADLAKDLRAEGVGLTRLDFGGGLGVVYRDETPPDLGAYAAAVRAAVKGTGFGLVLEPGRWMVADAGVLLARVVYVKHGSAKRFAILDAAMNDLIRPTLYEAWMPVEPVAKPRPGTRKPYDIVGPVCESGDYIALDREMPPLADGDLVAIRQAGAYGAVMSSSYNARPLAPELLVNGGKVAVVRARQTVEALIALDHPAPWQGRKAPRGA
ncbi:MAG: diaminopimelate decarboxylase [Alphaproteobacteria bacterium]|nr:diaminopimelate decarboxylase [Alphaproteobacteria bacterium]